MLEKAFQAKVMIKLRKIPDSFWLKTNDANTSGIPDIIGCYTGTFLGFELKTNSKVTMLQIYQLGKIEKAGGFVMVVTPLNFEKVLRFLLVFSGPKKGKRLADYTGFFSG